MTFRIVLIEDEDLESRRTSIQELNNWEVFAFRPPSNLDITQIIDAHADLFLVDYELDIRQDDDSIANYRGTTLAARIREDRSDVPIVLLTRSNLSLWISEQRTVEAGGTFDCILYKEEHLRDAPAATSTQLASLIHGYKVLRDSTDRSVSGLLALLNTDAIGRENALKALPPNDNWRAAEAARWMRSVLLNYPGVLYDQSHAATALGISTNSFNNDSVLELLERARYSGPFWQEKPLWWHHTLLDIANAFSITTDKTLGLRQGFITAVSKIVGSDLEPSKDTELATGLADTVCYLLNIPVRIEASLPYRPDARPPVMDEARISFKAIRETNDVDENHLDLADRILLEQIQRPPHEH